MKSLIVLLALVALPFVAPAAWAATLVAAPAPTGNDTVGTPCTDAQPCSVRRGLITMNCANNDVLELLDGVYQGANYVIDMVAFGLVGKSGTDGAHRCTVRARNDGAVFIDGQFARPPFWVRGNHWWKYEGFDVGNASAGDFVASIDDADRSIFQRLCFSNVSLTPVGANSHVLSFSQPSSNLLMEDICVFGTGRTAITESTAGNGNTFRRFWLRHEGWCPSVSGGDAGRYGFQAPYYEDLPNPITHGDAIYENFIVVWGPEQQNTVPCGTDSGAVGPGIWARTPSTPIDYKGFIFYARDGFNATGTTASTHPFVYDNHSTSGGSYTRRYVDIFVDRRAQTTDPFSGAAKPFNIRCISGALCNNNTADRLTALKAAATPASSFEGTTVTNGPPTNECTEPSSCPNFYTGTSPGTGSRACFEYSGGTLTATGLWPWRMDNRIKTALTRARTAGTGGAALAGTSGPGYAAATVTSEIVSRYGAIPGTCSRDGVDSPPAIAITGPTSGSSWTTTVSPLAVVLGLGLGLWMTWHTWATVWNIYKRERRDGRSAESDRKTAQRR